MFLKFVSTTAHSIVPITAVEIILSVLAHQNECFILHKLVRKAMCCWVLRKLPSRVFTLWEFREIVLQYIREAWLLWSRDHARWYFDTSDNMSIENILCPWLNSFAPCQPQIFTKRHSAQQLSPNAVNELGRLGSNLNYTSP